MLRMEPGNSELPLLPDDIDPDAAWIRATGWTPLEFLTHTYRNPWQKPSDRISAAKAILDYAHRRLPQELKLSGTPGAPLVSGVALTPAALASLTDSELETLTKLLDKMGGFKKEKS